MSPDRSILIFCLALAGCMAGGESPEPASDAGPPGAEPTVDVRSRSPALKRKTGAQLAGDLAQALELDPSELCLELGRFDCATEAHRIVLGGVEPYRLRIDRPLPVPGVGAPIATDRLSLAACGQRAQADFAGGSVMFGELAAGLPEGKARAVESIYRRLLGRAPDSSELDTFLEWDEPGLGPETFATLACFAVATSLEHLFY